MTKKTEKKEGNISINTDIKKTQKSICKYETISLLKVTTEVLEAKIRINFLAW